MISKSKGQIWIETVLYTLMGIALIGIVLAIAMPQINKSRDKLLVEQSIESMNALDEKIGELLDRGQGNVRNIQAFTMKRGFLYINSSNDQILFTLDGLSAPYSEVGFPIEFGKVTVISKQSGKSSSVDLILDYRNITNITYEGADEFRTFSSSATPYSFSFKNLGGDPIQIDIEETSRA